jgi:nucleoside 2-deoxyribosyltransferase
MENNFEVHQDKRFSVVLKNIVEKSQDFKGSTKKSIYLAGPWFDKRANNLYDAVKDIYNTLKNDSNYVLICPRDNVNHTPRDAFDRNVEDIKKCDLVVAMVSRKDVGTAWEIGMAYALGKKIYLLGYDETTFLSHTNVMLAFTGRCFTLDKWANFLLGTIDSVDFIRFENEWEGIE